MVSAFARTYGAEALIVRGSNNYGPRQHPEKLIPLCILNALARRPAPGLRRRHAGPQLALRRGLLLARSTPCSSAASRAQVYNAGGPDELPNIDVVRRILELTGRRRIADRVRQRPARPRPPLLARLGAARARSAGSRRSASTRASSVRSTGTARTSDWWEPIRSGDYRDYYERQYGQGSLG